MCLLIFFSASRWPVCLCLTRYTAPYAPLDTSLTTSKSSSPGGLVLARSPSPSSSCSSESLLSRSTLRLCLQGVEQCRGGASCCSNGSAVRVRPSLAMMYCGSLALELETNLRDV